MNNLDYDHILIPIEKDVRVFAGDAIVTSKPYTDDYGTFLSASAIGTISNLINDVETVVSKTVISANENVKSMYHEVESTNNSLRC